MVSLLIIPHVYRVAKERSACKGQHFLIGFRGFVRGDSACRNRCCQLDGNIWFPIIGFVGNVLIVVAGIERVGLRVNRLHPIVESDAFPVVILCLWACSFNVVSLNEVTACHANHVAFG